MLQHLVDETLEVLRSQNRKDERGYGHTTPATHDMQLMSTPPPLRLPPPRPFRYPTRNIFFHEIVLFCFAGEHERECLSSGEAGTRSAEHAEGRGDQGGEDEQLQWLPLKIETRAHVRLATPRCFKKLKDIEEEEKKKKDIACFKVAPLQGNKKEVLVQ